MTKNALKPGLVAAAMAAVFFLQPSGAFHLPVAAADKVAAASAATDKPAADADDDVDYIALGIQKKTEKLLKGHAHTAELTWQKAADVKAALKKGDFSTADKISADVYANSKIESWHFSPFNIFMPGTVDASDDDLGKGIDGWVAQQPKNALALLVRAQYEQALAWQARGSQTSNRIQGKQLDSFDDYLTKAVADIDAAIVLDDKNPYAYFLKVDTLYGRGNRPEIEAAFQQGIAKFPAYYNLYSRRLDSLAPKWGGSPDELYTFVNKYAGAAPRDSAMKMLYLNLYNTLLDAAAFSCDDDSYAGDAWKGCFVGVMAKLERQELDHGITDALSLYKTADKYQYNMQVQSGLGNAVRFAGTDNMAAGVLQRAADATGSDNQLVETNPGHNDYALDLLTAEQWYADENYTSAEKKYKEALTDIENAPFPDEEAKNLALSSIWQDLSRLYSTLGQYANAIIYQGAADTLDASANTSHMICWYYYKMADYPAAEDACKKVIDNNGSLDAHYWRAQAFLKDEKKDMAEKDLTAVAGSNWSSRHRGSAAIDISVLLGDRKDFQGMVSLFDKYSFLFDDRSQSKDDLAVAYNNRCYAYLHLDQLEKALDDCNTSLRYGNIPDAVEKRKEIMTRMKGHEKGI